MSHLLTGKTIVLMGVVNKMSIAWGCAQSMIDNGAKVIFTYQTDRVKTQMMKFVDADSEMIQCDVSNDEEIRVAFEEIGKKYGKIDGVVHSIAFARKEELEGSALQISREGFAIAHDISAFSLIAVAKEAEKIMNEGGSIVTMTYIGSQRAIPNYNAMGLAKASLEAAVRYLAVDMAERDIRVNAISAGAIKTLAASGIKDFGKLLDAQSERTPAGKQITKEEVGNTATFLMSNLSSGITGEIINVDKGFHLS